MQSTKTVLDIGTRLTAILGLGTGEAEAADRTVAMQTIEGTEVRETEHTMHKTDRDRLARMKRIIRRMRTGKMHRLKTTIMCRKTRNRCKEQPHLHL